MRLLTKTIKRIQTYLLEYWNPASKKQAISYAIVSQQDRINYLFLQNFRFAEIFYISF